MLKDLAFIKELENLKNFVNKYFKKYLLNTTAIIGLLLAANPQSVSADETVSPDMPEVIVEETVESEVEYENSSEDELIIDKAIEEESEEEVKEETLDAGVEEETDAQTEAADEIDVKEVEDSDEETDDLVNDELDENAVNPDENNSTGLPTEEGAPEVLNSVEADSEDLNAEDTDTVDVDEEVETVEVNTEEESNEDNLDKVEIESNDSSTPHLFKALTSNLSETRSAKVNENSVERIAGASRDHIAATISKRGWNSSNVVFLANGFKEADVLTGSPLARAYDAPILFTRTGNLPGVTLNEIQRLGASKVYILGGKNSVSDSVVQSLIKNNLSVERIDGRTRYDLASNIASRVMEIEGTNRDAYLVNGEAFADAISIAPVAANKRLPIFLTRSNALHTEVLKAIPVVHSWNIIGGLNSIPESIVSEMASAGAKISNRFDGKNRYEVNRNIIDFYFDENQEYTYVASGEVVSDALATTPLAGKEGASILLVRNNHINNLHEQTEFIKEDKDVQKYVLVGGEKTLSKFTENHFAEPIVYLDAGHGSLDTGAFYGGVAERDLNLPLSFEIQKQLNDYGYKVVMSRTTRENQYYHNSTSDLYARPLAANAIGADIYVSVHFDAMPGDPSVEGLSVFTYSPNYLHPPLPENINSHTDPIRLKESKELAEALQYELIRATGATDRGTRSGAYVVLREAKMPVVILELGFMSNPAELKKIQTKLYQDRLTTGVVNGINRYFLV